MGLIETKTRSVPPGEGRGIPGKHHEALTLASAWLDLQPHLNPNPHRMKKLETQVEFPMYSQLSPKTPDPEAEAQCFIKTLNLQTEPAYRLRKPQDPGFKVYGLDFTSQTPSPKPSMPESHIEILNPKPYAFMEACVYMWTCICLYMCICIYILCPYYPPPHYSYSSLSQNTLRVCVIVYLV